MSHFSKQLFVYGSLKQGFQFSHLMQGATFVGNAETVDGFIFVKHLGYPCLIKNNKLANHPAQIVRGEVYQINNLDHLKTLDEFEGAPEDYQREEISVKLLESNSIIKVETYISQKISEITQSGIIPIANGEWSWLENQPENQSYGSEIIDVKFLKS